MLRVSNSVKHSHRTNNNDCIGEDRSELIRILLLELAPTMEYVSAHLHIPRQLSNSNTAIPIR